MANERPKMKLNWDNENRDHHFYPFGVMIDERPKVELDWDIENTSDHQFGPSKVNSDWLD